MDALTTALGVPRNIIASGDEIESVWKVSIKTIAENGYNLDIKNPHQKEEEKQYSSKELLNMLHTSFKKVTNCQVCSKRSLFNEKAAGEKLPNHHLSNRKRTNKTGSAPSRRVFLAHATAYGRTFLDHTTRI